MNQLERLEILMESSNDKIDLLVERVVELGKIPSRIDSIDERLDHIESDVFIIKGAIRSQSSDILALKTAQ